MRCIRFLLAAGLGLQIQRSQPTTQQSIKARSGAGPAGKLASRQKDGGLDTSYSCGESSEPHHAYLGLELACRYAAPFIWLNGIFFPATADVNDSPLCVADWDALSTLRRSGANKSTGSFLGALASPSARRFSVNGEVHEALAHW